jgi:phage terminase large subunit-like protein
MQAAVARGRASAAAAVTAQTLLLIPEAERTGFIAGLPARQAEALNRDWPMWQSDAQAEPAGDWRVWLMLAGRGFGKTRLGAQWVRGLAAANPAARIALVAATMAEVRSVMVEGESGLLAATQAVDTVHWEPSLGRLTWGNGAQAFAYSAESPEALRGPQHHFAWCDELAKWKNGPALWDNLMLGLRLGEWPRTLVTTTPRSVALLRTLIDTPDVIVRQGATKDNPHLPPPFVSAVNALYAGTRLGRQELDGELIEDVQGALWSRALIESVRVKACPPVRRVVIGVDPPAGVGRDACGIVAVALGNDGLAYVIEDASVVGATPEGWARAVAACAQRNAADKVVAEANNGGAMVESVLRGADVMMPIKRVHAAHGKAARAEPVAALYGTGKAFHVGNTFAALEDELCGLVKGGGYQGPGTSPDRADALVWAMHELMLGQGARVPRVRGV